MSLFRRLGLPSFLAFLASALTSCVYDPGVSYYQPAPVYTRPVVTYSTPPPPPTYYHHHSRPYYSPRYVPPPPPPQYRYQPSYYSGPAVQFYYSMPQGASYLRMRGNPCWRYNGSYYRRNPRGAGFVLFFP